MPWRRILCAPDIATESCYEAYGVAQPGRLVDSFHRGIHFHEDKVVGLEFGRACGAAAYAQAQDFWSGA